MKSRYGNSFINPFPPHDIAIGHGVSLVLENAARVGEYGPPKGGMRRARAGGSVRVNEPGPKSAPRHNFSPPVLRKTGIRARLCY